MDSVLPLKREELLEYASSGNARVRVFFSEKGGLGHSCDGFVQWSSRDGLYVQLDSGPGDIYRLKQGDVIGLTGEEEFSFDLRKVAFGER
jgi:hypothetical protein